MLRPKPIEVKPLDNSLLYITFDNGENKIFDVKPLISGNWFGELEIFLILLKYPEILLNG